MGKQDTPAGGEYSKFAERVQLTANHNGRLFGETLKRDDAEKLGIPAGKLRDFVKTADVKPVSVATR